MYIHIEKNYLCGKGKSYLKTTIDDELESFFNKFKPKGFKEQIFRFFNSDSKQKYYKYLIYLEYKYLTEKILSEQDKYILILNQGNIQKLKEEIQSRSKIHDFLTYHLDYALDEFNIDTLSGKEEIDIEDILPLISYFYLKELLFYLILDDVTVLKRNKYLVIHPSLELEEQFKRRWLSMTWENESKNFTSTELSKAFMILNNPILFQNDGFR